MRQKAIHQPKDKSAKNSYGDWIMMGEFLDEHLPRRLLAGLDLRDPEVRKRRTLPLVLPIVVYVGTEPWDAPTGLEELLPKEAKPLLPFALGHDFLLVSEAEEAKALDKADTPRTAALKLRYAEDRTEFKEALATLKELLPEESPTRQALVEWVRTSRIDEGAKEEEMAELRTLEDLGSPVMETWWAKERREAREKGHAEGRAEGHKQGLREAEALLRRRQRATLVRLARRKFGAETAEALAALLEGVSDAELFDVVADLIVDFDSGRDLLAQVEDLRAGSR